MLSNSARTPGWSQARWTIELLLLAMAIVVTAACGSSAPAANSASTVSTASLTPAKAATATPAEIPTSTSSAAVAGSTPSPTTPVKVVTVPTFESAACGQKGTPVPLPGLTPGSGPVVPLTLAQAQELVRFCLKTPAWLPPHIAFDSAAAPLPPPVTSATGTTTAIHSPFMVTLYYTSNGLPNQRIGFQIDESSFKSTPSNSGATATPTVLAVAGKQVTKLVFPYNVTYYWQSQGISFDLIRLSRDPFTDEEIERVIASIP